MHIIFKTTLYLTAKNIKNSSKQVGARACKSWLIFWTQCIYLS